MKTERMVILLTPDEKRAITDKAKAMNLSAGEIVRRAVEDYRPDRDEELLLNTLAEELGKAVRETREALNGALKEMGETLDYFAAKREKNRRAA